MTYEIDGRVKIIVFIAIVLIVLSGIPFKIIKNTMYPPVANITKNVTPNVTYVYVDRIVTVTPTIDGKTYFASEYDTGVRKINNPFSFYRDNASGLKTLKVMSIVYDYKITPSYHWYNPSDAKDYEEKPPEGFKDLWVFYSIWLDGRVADDTRFYLPNVNNQFMVANTI